MNTIFKKGFDDQFMQKVEILNLFAIFIVSTVQQRSFMSVYYDKDKTDHTFMNLLYFNQDNALSTMLSYNN